MRILLVQESDWLEKGPHQSHHLMERLSQKGHEIRVIDFEIQWRKRSKNELISERLVFENVHKAIKDGTITVIRPSFIRLPILEYISLIYFHRNEIVRQIKVFKPDVIIGFGILNASIAIKIANKYKIPFLYYIIDELHRLVPQRIFRSFARYIEKNNLMNATEVFTINEGLRDYIVQLGALREKTEVIRAGVELDKFVPNEILRRRLREKFGFNNNDTVLFFMGWLYDFSGLKEVAMELAKPEWKNSGIKILVIGAGPLWEILLDIRNKNNLMSRLILEKWMPYEEIPKHILASDICILPAYKNEIMMNIVPIKMYEYMAAGKPVISTQLPGIEKEFGFGNGIIFIEKPEDTIKTAIEIKMDNKLDEIGNAARNFVKDNSWQKIVQIFEDKLKKVVG